MITNLTLYLLMAGTNIVYPAWDEREATLVSWMPHDTVTQFEASAKCVDDLRGGYTAATYDGTNVVVDGVLYAPYVAPPELHPSGIVTPIIYMPSVSTESNGFALAVQPDGTVDTEHWYGSPTNREAEIRAGFDRKHKAHTEANSNKLTRIERIAVDLQQVDAVISNINVNAATWANTNQRATMVSVKTAIRNLMQAAEKMRKEIEP